MGDVVKKKVAVRKREEHRKTVMYNEKMRNLRRKL